MYILRLPETTISKFRLLPIQKWADGRSLYSDSYAYTASKTAQISKYFIDK